MNTRHTSSDDPSLSETILVMDIADTIRHDDRMRDFELADDDRRQAMKERLRQAYAAQGDVVADSVIDRAIERRNADLYVHKDKLSGIDRLAWTVYVRRGKYTRIGLAAGAAFCLSLAGYSVAYEHFVTTPRLEIERKLAETLPEAANAAADYARNHALRLNDDIAVERVREGLAEATAAIKSKDVRKAEERIADIRDIGNRLKVREEEQIKAASAALAKEEAAKAKAQTAARLLAAMEKTVTSATLSAIRDEKARLALAEIADRMRDAATDGNEFAYETAYERFKSYAGYIRSPYEIRIVNRKGIQTGFARQHDQTGNKSWYLVVEAVSPTGTPYPLEIKDRLLDNTKTTTVWAIRVSERVINAVKNDKADGVLDNPVAGMKASGTLDIVWKVDAFDGQTLNTW